MLYHILVLEIIKGTETPKRVASFVSLTMRDSCMEQLAREYRYIKFRKEFGL